MVKYTLERRIKKFWEKVDLSNVDIEFACLEWTASLKNGRYGIVAWDGTKRSHRIAYYLAFGSFNQTLQVLHHCDNPKCVNPNHLFLGTNSDNMRDMVAKGRHKEGRIHAVAIRKARGDKFFEGVKSIPAKGEKHGSHKLTEQSVVEIRQKYIQDVYGYRHLAKEYGVSMSAIRDIVKRKRWKHI